MQYTSSSFSFSILLTKFCKFERLYYYILNCLLVALFSVISIGFCFILFFLDLLVKADLRNICILLSILLRSAYKRRSIVLLFGSYYCFIFVRYPASEQDISRLDCRSAFKPTRMVKPYRKHNSLS